MDEAISTCRYGALETECMQTLVMMYMHWHLRTYLWGGFKYFSVFFDVRSMCGNNDATVKLLITPCGHTICEPCKGSGFRNSRIYYECLGYHARAYIHHTRTISSSPLSVCISERTASTHVVSAHSVVFVIDWIHEKLDSQFLV